MTDLQISEAEVKIIRWGEKILTPLLIAGFMGIVSFLWGVNNTVAQLGTEHIKYNDTNGDLKASVEKLNVKVDHQLATQHKLEVSMEHLSTTQGNFEKQVDDIKAQNSEIIRLLRASPR